MITLPGLIDPHVHLRDPGQTEKEDFYTGTAAALAGGFTLIVDMPNSKTPITTLDRLMAKKKIAKKKIVCDIGLYFGTLGENLTEFPKVQNSVLGLKVYLNQTTGNYLVDQSVFRNICKAWPAKKPILVHAEKDVLEEILHIGSKMKQTIHVCHVSSQSELEIIIQAKKRGQHVTCGVTPHHLFLTENDVKKLGGYAMMKPPLKTIADQTFLWENLEHIDIIESDHAPHTKEEKESKTPSFGVTGLETTLPLLLTTMNEGRLKKEDIINKCFTRPKEIFHMPDQPNTFVEVDEKEEGIIKNENLFTKCKWTPFDGWKTYGTVKRVTIRGTKVFENGKILVNAGFGKILSS